MAHDVTFLIERGYALDGHTPPFEAIRVIDGVTVWTGTAREARSLVGAQAQERLDGVYLVPGLVDTHLHLGLMGRGEDAVDLSQAKSIAEVVSAVGARAHAPWIEGVGWDDSSWARPMDPAALHGALPDVPIILHRRDHHAAWVSRSLLRLACVLDSADSPPGGRIERDPEGHPTGILIDTALEAARAALPQPNHAQRRQWITRALHRCQAAGLTGVHEICTPHADLMTLRRLAGEDGLPVRVAAFLHADDPANEALLCAGPAREGRLSVVGAKLFCDGALGSRGAWLSAPYADQPDTSGVQIVHGPALVERVIRYGRAGFAVAVHGIGDAAVDEIIDAFAQARGAGIESPLRLEHAQIVSPNAVARLAALDIICAVQPIHAIEDAAWFESRIGPARSRWAYRLGSLCNAGVRVVLGTDAPISRVDPLAGLRAAISSGRPRAGAEALTTEAALRCHSVAAAYAAGEQIPPTLVGRAGDFTLMDGDPLSGKDLEKIGVVGTVVDGRLNAQLLEPISLDL